jgi:hypothetical protein
MISSRSSACRFPYFKLVPAACLAAGVFLGGCSSQPDYVPEHTPEQQAERPTMQGLAGFFEGKLLVEASLGRGFRLRAMRKKDFHSRAGLGDGFTDVYLLEEPEPEAQVYLPRMANSTLPPVALRLRVTNGTDAPVDVEFLHCDSSLGNFAVRPEHLAIAPGESGIPDPMTSLLGVMNNEIQLTVGLRLAGKSESKAVVLKVLPGQSMDEMRAQEKGGAEGRRNNSGENSKPRKHKSSKKPGP